MRGVPPRQRRRPQGGRNPRAVGDPGWLPMTWHLPCGRPSPPGAPVWMPGPPGCVSPSLGVRVCPVRGSGIFPPCQRARPMCAPTPVSQVGVASAVRARGPAHRGKWREVAVRTGECRIYCTESLHVFPPRTCVRRRCAPGARERVRKTRRGGHTLGSRLSLLGSALPGLTRHGLLLHLKAELPRLRS